MIRLKLLLFFFLLIVCRLTAASDEVDCRRLPDVKAFANCCVNSSLVFEAEQNCSFHAKSGDPHWEYCYDGCILGNLGLFSNNTVELEGAIPILEEIYNSTGEFLPKVYNFYNSCSSEAVRHKEDYREFYETKTNCSQVPFMIMTCLFFHVFNQCPEAHFQNETECLGWKKQLDTCLG